MGNLVVQGFITQKFIGDTVNVYCFFFYFTLWIDIHMKVVASKTAIYKFNTTDFNNAVALLWVNTRGFCI